MDKTMLIYGASSSGKSTSLRNLPLERTVFENVEGKPLPFKGANRLYKHNKPKTLSEVKIDIKEAVEDPNVDLIIFDSITMFGDNILYPAVVKSSDDTRKGWQVYKDELAGMLEYCKKSGKNFVFLALEKDVYNKKEMVEKTMPSIQGSMATSLPSHFTYVFYTTTIERDGKLEYVFQTNRTVEKSDVTAKSPMGMFENVYIPNDVALVLDVMEKWNEED